MQKFTTYSEEPLEEEKSLKSIVKKALDGKIVEKVDTEIDTITEEINEFFVSEINRCKKIILEKLKYAYYNNTIVELLDLELDELKK